MSKPEWRDILEEQVEVHHNPSFVKGSRPRCVLLVQKTERDRSAAAETLSSTLLDSKDAITPNDQWMPFGLPALSNNPYVPNTIASSEVDFTRPNPFLHELQSTALESWWFGPKKNGRSARSDRSKAPTWDLVATRGAKDLWGPRPRGLVLVEAKAHQSEPFERTQTPRISRQEIVINEMMKEYESAIFEAGAQYDKEIYQLLNRFAFGLKLAELGFEVDLVFLGFLDASEMPTPFASHDAWEKHIHSKSKHVVLGSVWTSEPHKFETGGSFRARIRSTTVPL